MQHRFYHSSSQDFSYENVPERKEWPKIRPEVGGVSHTNARKKGSQMPFQLCPSE
jgi:hypothetical protein